MVKQCRAFQERRFDSKIEVVPAQQRDPLPNRRNTDGFRKGETEMRILRQPENHKVGGASIIDAHHRSSNTHEGGRAAPNQFARGAEWIGQRGPVQRSSGNGY